MKKNKLEINTVNVQIRVLTLDGKRLTKAVFNQIHSTLPLPGHDNEAIGLIRNQNGDDWYLWTCNGMIFKTSTKALEQAKREARLETETFLSDRYLFSTKYKGVILSPKDDWSGDTWNAYRRLLNYALKKRTEHFRFLSRDQIFIAI